MQCFLFITSFLLKEVCFYLKQNIYIYMVADGKLEQFKDVADAQLTFSRLRVGRTWCCEMCSEVSWHKLCCEVDSVCVT